MSPTHAVGTEILVDLDKEAADPQLAPCARDARLTIDNDPSIGEVAAEQQRIERQEHAGWIAAGTGDEVSARDLVAIHLGQPVHRLGQEAGHRVLDLVPLLVHSDVAQPEICGQVDGPHASRQHSLDRRHGLAVWQAQERHVDLFERRILWPDQSQVIRAGIQVAHPPSGAASRGAKDDLYRGMPFQQFDQLVPGIARRSKDPYSHHLTPPDCAPCSGTKKRPPRLEGRLSVLR